MAIHKYKTKRGETLFRGEIDFAGRGKARKRMYKSGFRTKTECKNWMAHEKSKLLKGNVPVSPKLTVEKYLEDWYEHHFRSLHDVGINTIKLVRLYLDLSIPHIGQIKVQELEPAHVLHMRDKFNAIDPQKGKPRLAKQTTRLVEGRLKGAFKDGVKLGKLTKNPLEFLVGDKINKKRDKKPPNPFSASEQGHLMETAEKYSAKRDDLRWWMLIHLALKTGARYGEIMGLTWANVDLEKQKIRIEQAITYDDESGDISDPKTENSIRNIYINSNLVEALKRYRAWQSEWLIKLGKPLDNDTLLMLSNDLGIMNKSVAQGRYKTIVKNAELPKRGFHQLRHTHAGNWCNIKQNKNNPYALMRRLGHSDIQTTLNIYAHLFDLDSLELAVDTLDQIDAKIEDAKKEVIQL